MWDYDDVRYAQRLVRVIALCAACHEVKHIGSQRQRSEHQWSLNLEALGSFGVNVGMLIAQGRRNREIAEELVISEKTVNHHVSNIFSKSQVEDLAQAIVRAREAGQGLPTA